MWTVKKIREFLEQYPDEAKVFFQDRLGRKTCSPYIDLDTGIWTLDVIIGVDVDE